ncbi:MAG: hypothetical protein GY869_01470 [Planctomycetes bacterium]|nr:hypothetical protein [Planctomycetota bacterium]
MKIMKNLFLVLILFSVSIYFGCSADQPTETAPEVDSGTADFTTVAAIGASFEAGHQDGYLTVANEIDSYPGMIAQQMGLSVGTESSFDFVVPEFDPGVGNKMDLAGFTPSGSPIINYEPLAGPPLNMMTHLQPYNNLAVPGALSSDLMFAVDASTAANPTNVLFDLILRNPVIFPDEPKTQVTQAIALNSTFVIIGILGNDVLGAATSGHTTPGLPVSVDNYAAAYGGIVGSLKAALPDVDLVGINIPDVTTLPYFTAVSIQVEVPGVGMADLVIETGAGGVRQTQEGDLILLTASAIIGTPNGDGLPYGLHELAPLPSSLVLDNNEISEISAAIEGYNTRIQDIADANGFPVVDAYSLMNELAGEGLEFGGIVFTAGYITGGAFSLDGVHANTVGYAIIANEMIETINDFYGSNIPPLNIQDYYYVP